MGINNKKGFTLIELLIVVAIIAILAAIAIPQFGAYRIKGYNAAASADVRNAKNGEEALYADFQGYGDSSGITQSGPVILTTKDAFGITRSVSVPLSNGVHMKVITDVATGLQGNNYVIITKHKQGDRIFAADVSVTTLYWRPSAGGSDLSAVDPGLTSTTGSDITSAGWTAL